MGRQEVETCTSTVPGTVLLMDDRRWTIDGTVLWQLVATSYTKYSTQYSTVRTVPVPVYVLVPA
jgi:hypothetical protein